jgi:hypothetical protein
MQFLVTARASSSTVRVIGFFFMKTADHLREIARKFSTLHGQENLPKF